MASSLDLCWEPGVVVAADPAPEADGDASVSGKGGGKSSRGGRGTKRKTNSPVMLSTSYTCWRKVPDSWQVSQALLTYLLARHVSAGIVGWSPWLMQSTVASFLSAPG